MNSRFSSTLEGASDRQVKTQGGMAVTSFSCYLMAFLVVQLLEASSFICGALSRPH